MSRATVYDRLHNRLMSGEGLRPVLRYARLSPVNVVRIDHSVSPFQLGRYAVTFYFDDGAECLTYWQDWRVLLTWLAARRSWSVERVRLASTGPDIPSAHAGVAALQKRGVSMIGFR